MPDTKAPLKAYLKVQVGYEKQLIALLNQAKKEAQATLDRLVGKTNVSSQLSRARAAALKRELHQQTAALYRAQGELLQAAKEEAAAAAIDVMSLYDDSLVLRGLTPTQVQLLRSAEEVAALRGLEVAQARVQGQSYRKLSEQVYRTQALSNGVIDARVNEALARGASAQQLADSVVDLINPNTPGGISYASKRLGRTELNNAFHATTVEKGKKTPWVTGMRWELSGSHTRPDECNEYAEEVHMVGGEPGVFRPEDVPVKPHPQCLCFLVPVTPSVDDFLKQLDTGAYDNYLDDVMRDAGYSDEFIASSRLGAPKTTTTAPTIEDLEDQIKAIQEERDPAMQQLLDDAYGRKTLDPALKAQLEQKSSLLYKQQLALREQIEAMKVAPQILKASDDAVAAFKRLSMELDDDARRSLQMWASDEYKFINGAIPDGKTLSLRGVNPEYRAAIESIDDAMDYMGGETLYRGMTRGLDDLKVGDVLTSNSFTATSTDIHTAAGFSQSAGSVAGTVQAGDTVTLLRISTGSRARGVAVPGSPEYEILLARGSKLKVTGFSDEVIDGVNYHFVEVKL